MLLDMAVTTQQHYTNSADTVPAPQQVPLTPWSTSYRVPPALRSNTPIMAACEPMHISCTLSRDRQYAARTDHIRIRAPTYYIDRSTEILLWFQAVTRAHNKT